MEAVGGNTGEAVQQVTSKPRPIYTRPSAVPPTSESAYQLPFVYHYRYRAPKRYKLSPGSESDEQIDQNDLKNDDVQVRYPRHQMYRSSHHMNIHRDRHTERHTDKHVSGPEECHDDEGEDDRCSSPSLPRKMARLSNDDSILDLPLTPAKVAPPSVADESDQDLPSPTLPKDLSRQRIKASQPLTPPSLESRDDTERFDDGLGELNSSCEMGDADEEQKKQEWSFQEQFRQLYDLSDCPERKPFLDSLFSFMQKRGTPVNRIPIMAKQVLDLYELYNQVVAKGGLVEVINKKQWREITKGLNLPASITSAAFTLRTQYMKYLYPYECATKSLSSPAELQAAIDGNRREGRRPAYHTHGPLSFGLHPSALSPPPTMIPHPSRIDLRQQLSPAALYGDDLSGSPSRRSSDGGGYHHERETPPPLRRRPYVLDETAQRLLLHPQQIPPSSAHIKMSSQKAHPETGFPFFEFRGDNTMVVSIELNGLLYQGVLYPCGSLRHPLHPANLATRQPLLSHDH